MFDLTRRIFLAAGLSFASLPVRAAEPVVVFAPTSLKPSLDLAAAEWAQVSGERALITYGASSELARQVAEGADVDVFLSSDAESMDLLDAGGFIKEGKRFDLLGNTLVLIGGPGHADPVPVENADVGKLLAEGKVALAAEGLPLGTYGRESLRHLGVWETVEPHLLIVETEPGVVAAVAEGRAAYGIAYGTDAVAQKAVTLVATFPPESHAPIFYPIAVMKAPPHPAEADGFVTFLSSEPIRALFEAHGFVSMH